MTSKDLWEDPSFPANDSSLGFSSYTISNWNVKWMRPNEIMEEYNNEMHLSDENKLKPLFIVDGVRRSDVVQTNRNDCWFLAAVSNLANEENADKKSKYNWWFQQVVPTHQNFDENYSGFFYFRFWENGKWKEVTIDDRLPTDGQKLLFASSKEPNEFWAALLEKAYAKFHGSYYALEVGDVGEAFTNLTGGITEYVDVNRKEKKDDSELQRHKRNVHIDEALNDSLCRAEECRYQAEKKCLVGALIMDAYLDSQKTGLHPNHFYCINDNITVDTINGPVQLLRLRNTFVDVKWKLDWSNDSEKWKEIKDKEVKERLLNKEDGEFWMALEDFKTYFTIFEICVAPEWFTSEVIHEFEWQRNHVSRKIPVFKLTSEGSGHLTESYLEISQEGRRRNWKKTVDRYPEIGFEIYKLENEKKNVMRLTDRKKSVVKYLKGKNPGEYIITPIIYEDGKFSIRFCQSETTWQLWRIK